MTKPVLFFDFDGTLVDTEALASSLLAKTCLEFEIQLTQDELHSMLGVKWETGLASLRQRLGSNFLEISNRVLSRYRTHLPEVAFLPGAMDFIKSVKNHSRLWIVTGSHGADVAAILRANHADRYFEATIAAEDYQNSKPSPEPFLTGIQRAFGGSLPKNSAIAIEDSLPGLHSARSAGLHVYHITQTLPSRSFEPPKPVDSIPHWNEVMFSPEYPFILPRKP